MKQILLIVDVQFAFSPPKWLVEGVQKLARMVPSVASVELHNKSVTPFRRQLGWSPAETDKSLVNADKIFIKYGYCQSVEALDYLKSQHVDRVLVCGVQTETCVLSAGFSLFDLGLVPTLITDLTVGSSMDRSGKLGIDLWKHHFKNTITSRELFLELLNN